VVSKEEVAAGRKGGGGTWAGVDQPECGAGRAPSPAKWPNTNEHWRKKKRNTRSLGCGLQFGGAKNDLLAIRLQSSKTPFGVARTSNSTCLVLYLV
jgi:hypothetical protein